VFTKERKKDVPTAPLGKKELERADQTGPFLVLAR
jgi:hypothetical protein